MALGSGNRSGLTRSLSKKDLRCAGEDVGCGRLIQSCHRNRNKAPRPRYSDDLALGEDRFLSPPGDVLKNLWVSIW